jgi:DNA repair protein SbcC/Rad50
MIPLKLQIKNFLSYGPQTQTIDWEPHHLICLSGKNGHGKSALLDAMTWAIWGQARKVAGNMKADEGLLRLGQSTMMVMSEFICHGNHYRIRREFSFMAGKSHAQLDFGIIDHQTHHCKPLTDKTIRGTQERIIEAIGLDYDGFINSVFLRQGQSNEFSKKSPKDRKEILAMLLGLRRYEELRRQAFEKMRAMQADREVRGTLRDHLVNELNQQEHVPQQLHHVQEQLTQLIDQETALHQQKIDNEVNQKKLNEHVESLGLLAFSHEYLLRTIEQRREHLRQLVHTWRMVQHYRSYDENIDQELSAIEHKITHLQQQMGTRISLQEHYLVAKEYAYQQEQRVKNIYESKKLELEKVLHTQQQLIQAHKEKYHEKENDLKKRLAEHTAHETVLKELQTTIAHSLQHESAHAHIEQQFERYKTFYQKFSLQKNILHKECTQVAHHQETFSLGDKQSTCPLCQQIVPEKKQRILHDTFSHNKQRMHHQIERLERTIASLKTLLTSHHTSLQTLRTLREERKIQQHQEHALKETLVQHSTLHKEERTILNTLQQTIMQEERTLAVLLGNKEQHATSYNLFLMNDQSHQQAVAKLHDIEHTLNQSMYDQSFYEGLLRRREELHSKQKTIEETVKSRALQEQRKQDIHTLCLQLKQHKKERTHLEQQLAPSAHIKAQQDQLTKQQHILAEQHKELLKAKELLIHQKGILEHQVHQLAQRKKDLASYQAAINQLDTTIQDYQAIIHALSKDGIQALLIDEALPEIEQEANHLLGKLTDNQAHLSIESLRDLKSGGTKETLDIKISDSLGIRPYELFSGGEAFRIDFALRIALSKLLARRAGTSLQTLIIDEGFGSQDEDGLTHIMDALHKIQDDFAKIIIVSHLPSMKDQFPVHFIVNKGPHGSSVRIIEQG